MSGFSVRDTFTAKVTNINDPEMKGRIRVESQDLLAAGTEWPDWVRPSFPYAGINGASGWFFLPAVGDFVEIDLIVSHTMDDAPGQALLMNADPRWRCALYPSIADLPAEFKAPYGKRFGIRTPKGNLFLFDEATGAIILKAATLIRIGSETSAEPLLLGLIMQGLLSSMLDAIAVHTHVAPSGGGTTTPPDNFATFTALKASPVDDGGILSGKAFTEK